MTITKIDKDMIEETTPQPNKVKRYDRETLINLRHKALAELSRVKTLQTEMGKE